MKRILSALVLLPLCSCSSGPSFRRAPAPGEEGYTVHASSSKEIFDVSARLPAGMKAEHRYEYLARAVGEECLARGFLFFDLGPLGPSNARGFCYPHNRKKGLGVHFDIDAFAGKDGAVKVLDTVMNTHTPLRPRDVLRKISGHEVETIGDYKSEIFKLAAEGRSSATVLVERSGVALNLEAPITEYKEKMYTPAQLEELRKKYP